MSQKGNKKIPRDCMEFDICDPGDFGVITFNALIYKDLEK